jgi:anti-sigma factor RsiW
VPETRLDHDHAHYQELLGAYALGALPEEERVSFERHLAGCPTCQQELRPLLIAARALPLGVGERTPSPSLRERLRRAALDESEAVRHEAGQVSSPPIPRIAALYERRLLIPWLAAAALLLFSVTVLGWNLRLRSETESIALEPAAAPQAHGQVVYLRNWNIMLILARDFPPL